MSTPRTVDELTGLAQAAVTQRHGELIEVSHEIHAHPELAFAEERASALLVDALRGVGMQVETGTAGLRTAFTATAGNGPLNLYVCAEYDALPGIGHACGHNVIAATALGTAIALTPLVDDLGITLTVIGTPAEESGHGGKVVMNDAGAFDAADAVFLIHPTPFDAAGPVLIASQGFDFAYTGVPAHAAAAPHEGRNAADAAVLAQVAIGLLRQQLPSDRRVHGFVSEAGEVSNIIPAYSAGRYAVRSPQTLGLDDLYSRVVNCFEAGALATGCELEMTPTRRYAHMSNDARLAQIYQRNAEALGRDFTITHPDRVAGFTPSTDLGIISLERPTIHPFIKICDFPIANHQAEFTAAAAAPQADAAIADGAAALAGTIIDVARDGQLRSALIDRTA